VQGSSRMMNGLLHQQGNWLRVPINKWNVIFF
jgi:hypothetical protein